MLAFLAARAVRLAAVLVAIVVASFLFMRAIPGDPATIRLGEHASAADVATLTRALGLDRPWYVQLGDYLAHVARGDLGTSVSDDRPVADELASAFPATLELSLAAMLLATGGGIALGVAAARRAGRWTDAAIGAFTLLGVSLPVYWLGWILLYVLGVLPGAVGLDLFPISGRLSFAQTVPPVTHLMVVDALLARDPAAALDALRHLALPALTLATIPLAIVTKITRTAMLEVLRSDYVRTARAKGLGERAIVVKHALRNAAIPILTVLGLQSGLLLGGAVLTEHIFAWPGVGRLAFDAISHRDMPLVDGCLLLFALVFVVANALVDVLYALADPRIRYAR